MSYCLILTPLVWDKHLPQINFRYILIQVNKISDATFNTFWKHNEDLNSVKKKFVNLAKYQVFLILS